MSTSGRDRSHTTCFVITILIRCIKSGYSCKFIRKGKSRSFPLVSPFMYCAESSDIAKCGHQLYHVFSKLCSH